MGIITSVPKLLQKIEKEVAKAILRRIWNPQADALFHRVVGKPVGNTTAALSRDEFQVFAAEILIAHIFQKVDQAGDGHLDASKIREYLVRAKQKASAKANALITDII